jgi:hypothetical protein
MLAVVEGKLESAAGFDQGLLSPSVF